MPGASKNAERGESLGEAAAAQFAREAPVSSTMPAPASARGRRIAESELPNSATSISADEGDHRGDIDVAPGEMAGEREVVQLVDEVAVVAAGVKVEDQFQGGNRSHQHSGSELPARAKFRHAYSR